MTQPAQLAHILASSPYQEHAPHQRRALSSPGDCSGGAAAGSTSSPAASSSDARYFPHHGGFSDSSDIEGNSNSSSTYSNYSSPPSSAQSSANTSFAHHQAFPIDCYASSSGKTDGGSASTSSSSYAYQSSPLSHEHYYSSSASVSQHHPLHSYQLHQYQQPQSQQQQQQQYHTAPLMHTSHSMTQQHSQPMHDNQLPPLPDEHYQQHQSLHSSHGYSSQQSHSSGEMDTSMFRSQYGGLPPLQAPRAGCIPGLSMDKPASAASSADKAAAPALKRSRTAPGLIFSSPTAAAADAHQKLKEKRPAGKNGEDVWPEDVEIAFFESIRLVPKLGRKKIVVNDKPCGRNELIGDYIRRKTGRIRSRKQVSSHIQVLKNIKADDAEFMNLVAEPKAGEGEDDFRPDAKTLFFLPQEFAHVWKESPSLSASPPELTRGYRSYAIPPTSSAGSAIQSQFLSQPLAPLPSRDGLLSPYCSGNGSFFSQSSSSSASSPGPSSACSTRAHSPYYPLPTPGGTSDMTNQVFHLSLDPPSPHVFYQGATPTAPMSTGAISGPVPAEYNSAGAYHALEDSSSAPTPKVSPSKLGHRRAASKGLSLHIPPNDFNKLQPRQPEHANGGHIQLQPQASASNPSTPWPQMLHTPVNPPPAPNMLGSPTQKNRLQAVWARDTADWNKASPALEGAFNYELGDALSSSQNLQKMAARQSTPLKRSYTEGDCSPAKKTRKGGDAADEDDCAVPAVPALTPAHAPTSSIMRQSRSSVGAFSFPPKPAAAETCSSPAAYPFGNVAQRDVFDARASSPYQQPQHYSQHSHSQQSQPVEPVSQDDAFFSSLLGAREV